MNNNITYDDIGDDDLLTWSAREERRSQLLPGIEDEIAFSNYLFQKFLIMIEDEKNRFDSLLLLYDVYLQEVLKALKSNPQSILLLKCLVYLLDRIKDIKKTTLFNQLSSELKQVLFNDDGIPYCLLKKYQEREYMQIKSLSEKKAKNVQLLYCITKAATQFDNSIDLKLLKLTFHHWKQYTKECKLLLKSQYNVRMNPDDYRAQRFAFHAWLTTAKHERCINLLKDHAVNVEKKVSKWVIEVEHAESKLNNTSLLLNHHEEQLNDKRKSMHEKEINAQLFTLKSFEQSIISTALDLLLKEVELLRKEFTDRPGLNLFMLSSNFSQCLKLQNDIAVIESKLEVNGPSKQLIELHDTYQSQLLESEREAWTNLCSLTCEQFLTQWILSFSNNHHTIDSNNINNNNDNDDNHIYTNHDNINVTNDNESDNNDNNNNESNNNNNNNNESNNNDNSESDNNDNNNNEEVIMKTSLQDIFSWLSGIFSFEWNAFISGLDDNLINDPSKLSFEDAVKLVELILNFISSRVTLTMNIKPNVFLKLHHNEIQRIKKNEDNPLMFMTEVDDDDTLTEDVQKELEANQIHLAKQYHNSIASLCFLARPYSKNEIKMTNSRSDNLSIDNKLNEKEKNTLGLRRSSITLPSQDILHQIKSTSIEFRSLNGRLLRLQRIWAMVVKDEYNQDEARPQILNTLLSVRRSLECVVQLNRQRQSYLDILIANIREYSLELSENMKTYDITKSDHKEKLVHLKLKQNQIKDLNIDYSVIAHIINQHVDALSSVYKYYASLNNISYGVITLSSFMVFVKDIGLDNSGTTQVIFTRSCRRVNDKNTNMNIQQRSINESGFFEAIVRLSCHFNINMTAFVERILKRASSLTVGSFIYNMENSLVLGVYLAYRKELRKLYDKFCRTSVTSTLSRDNFLKLMRDISMVGYQSLTEHILNNLFSEIMFIPKIVVGNNEITYEGFLYALGGCAEYCNPNPFDEPHIKLEHFLAILVKKI